jgi:hypothetical protein
MDVAVAAITEVVGLPVTDGNAGEAVDRIHVHEEIVEVVGMRTPRVAAVGEEVAGAGAGAKAGARVLMEMIVMLNWMRNSDERRGSY